MATLDIKQNSKRPASVDKYVNFILFKCIYRGRWFIINREGNSTTYNTSPGSSAFGKRGQAQKI